VKDMTCMLTSLETAANQCKSTLEVATIQYTHHHENKGQKGRAPDIEAPPLDSCEAEAHEALPPECGKAAT